MRLVAADFFVLRTPLLAFSELAAWSNAITRSWDQDRRLLRDRLRDIVARPEVREAIFVASPSLEESIPAWLMDPESGHGQKVERALVRYVQRMAARPTPFGLFAGCSLGRLGNATRLELEARNRYQRHSRLDGDHLTALVPVLLCDTRLRHRLRFFPNTSLYRAAGRWRYAEYRFESGLRSYHLVAIEPSDYFEATIARAKDGATLPQLARQLTSDDVEYEEALEFIEELARRQLLVCAIEPQVTGPEPIHGMIAQLEGHEAARPLVGARDALLRLDASPLGASPSAYRAVADLLKPLGIEPKSRHLFQVDLIKPAVATLGPEPVAELVRVIEQLRRLSRSTGGASSLERFRRAFVERYQEREVPLAEALDDEVGVGFERSSSPTAEASPLLDGLVFPNSLSDQGASFSPLHALLFDKLNQRSATDEITLEPGDLKPLEVAPHKSLRLPASLAVTATLYARSMEAVSSGDFSLALHGVHGPSGANLLGRFCHGDPALAAHVLAHLREEEAQHPDVVFAEVVHLPEGRVGNLLLRPCLRDYEIEFLGRSGCQPDQRLSIEDLLLSVHADRIVLRSRRLGREVIPRLTSAHHFAGPSNLGLYRFLCALQHQGTGSLGIDWGPLKGAHFLPRLRIGKVVLQPRRWRIAGAQLKPLHSTGAVDVDEVERWREAHRLPRWVAVTDGDRLLPVDFDNPLSVDTFCALVKRRPTVTLTELATDGLCAVGPEGAFIHELVLPMISENPSPPIAPIPVGSFSVVRRRPPGSEWLYAKLYCGASAADRLLRDTIAPSVNEARASGAIDSWFFVRYCDPDWHLRIRFRGDPARLRSDLLPLIERRAEKALERGEAWRVQFDTYEREIERYGGDYGIALAEELFCADSDACLAIIQHLAGDDGADRRWRLTLRGMDQLLDDLGFSLREKLAIAKQARMAYATEHGADASFDHQVGRRFRKERPVLEALLDRGRDADCSFADDLRVFAARSERLGPIAASLRAAPLTVSLPELALSFLHMHSNRLLRSSQRAHELVLHDFLARLYQGRIARPNER